MPACFSSLLRRFPSGFVGCCLPLFATSSWAEERLEIDVLIVHTAAVTAYHGGSEGVQAHAMALIAGSNLALEDSGIAGRFRLAGLLQVNYSESQQSLNEDISRMWNGSDGFMDEIAAERTASGADLVCLLRKGAVAGTAGTGYVLRAEEGRDDVAYSVVATEFASSTFLHELGHNLGAHHARGDQANGAPSWGGLHEWSNGYRFGGSDGQRYRTLMAYSPGFHLMRFSNPNGRHGSLATGRTSANGDSADNARTLNLLFPVVAGYRAPVAPPVDSRGVRSITPLEQSVADFRDGYQIAVEADGEWAVTASPDWLRIQRQDGEGHDGTLLVEVDPFDAATGFFGPRSGEIVIGEHVHRVTQAAVEPVVELATHVWSVPASGGTRSLALRSNIQWTAHSHAPEWVFLGSEAAATSSGYGDAELRVTVSENRSSVERAAIVSVLGAQFQITQMAANGGADDGGGDGHEYEDFVAGLELGSVAFARYDAIMGRELSALFAAERFPDAPDSVETAESFEFPGDGENFGLRAWAWLVPEVSGEYRFWIASDDEGLLSLSNSEDSESAEVVARVPGHTPPRRYDLYPQQRSDAVRLEAGRPYYLEALMKQGWSGVNLSVAWSGPGIARQIIPGRVLGLPRPAGEPSPGPTDFVPTGRVNMAHYLEIPGKSLESLHGHPRFPESPDAVSELEGFSWLGAGDNFGLFAWAWLRPSRSGDYTFWLASDDEGELLLGAGPEDTVRIAHVPEHTAHEAFDRFPGQQSEPVRLEAEQVYYIAALAKQGWGGTNLSVAWQGPGFNRQILSGTALGQVEEPDAPTEWERGALAIARYNGIMGKTLSDLAAAPAFPHQPTRVETLQAFDYPDGGDNYGLLAWGWLVPEVTGAYRFWLASDDQGELSLSPDTNADEAVVIAAVHTHTRAYEYDKFSLQQSPEVQLEAGKAYFIQARVKQGWGDHHLSVAWSGPGFSRQLLSGPVLALPPGPLHPPSR